MGVWNRASIGACYRDNWEPSDIVVIESLHEHLFVKLTHKVFDSSDELTLS